MKGRRAGIENIKQWVCNSCQRSKTRTFFDSFLKLKNMSASVEFQRQFERNEMRNSSLDTSKCIHQNVSDILGDSLILNVFSFLNKRSLLVCSFVSKNFFVISTDSSNRVWQSLSIHESYLMQRLIIPRYSSAKWAHIRFFQKYFDDYADFMKDLEQKLTSISCGFEFLSLCFDSYERCWSKSGEAKVWQKIWSDWMKMILSIQPKLTQLALIHCVEPVQVYIESLPASQKLLSLYLENKNTVVTDQCLATILSHCPHLQDLIMYGPAPDTADDELVICFSNNGMHNILAGLAPTLIRLELGGCRDLNFRRLNKTMFPIDIKCFSLQEVCIGNLTSLCDEGLCAFIRYAPNIQKLIIEGTVITKEGFLSKIGGLSKLQYLDISSMRLEFDGTWYTEILLI